MPLFAQYVAKYLVKPKIDDFDNININNTIDICKKNNLFSCGINYKLFSKSLVDEFKKNNIQINVYSDKNISADVAKNLMMKFFYEVSKKQNLRVNS